MARRRHAAERHRLGRHRRRAARYRRAHRRRQARVQPAAGWTPAEDTLPERFLDPPLPNDALAHLSRERLEALVAEYRAARLGLTYSWTQRAQEAGVSQRCAIILRRVEVSERPELRIDHGHLLRLHAPRPHGVEEEYRPQSITREQRLDMREGVAPVDCRERMRKAVDLHDGDIVVAHQLDHSLDKRRHQQWHVAAGDVGRIDRRRQGAQSRRGSLQAALRLPLVARDADLVGNGGSDCPRAATTTIGETTVPSRRTTRCSMVSVPKGSVALGTPIRVDFPPHNTIPPVVTPPVSGSR